MMDRSAAWCLLTEFTQSESLRKHALAVEACMLAYGRKFAAASASAFSCHLARPTNSIHRKAKVSRGDRRNASLIWASVSSPRPIKTFAEPISELRRVLRIARAQLVPFIAGMPKRGNPAEPAPLGVTQMLLRSPPDRPEAGGSRGCKR